MNTDRHRFHTDDHRLFETAQSILEYTLIVGIVAVVLVALTPYLKRSIQSVVKTTADQMGIQSQSEQVVSDRSTYLAESFSARRDTIDEEYIEVVNAAKMTIYDDTFETSANATTSLGFTNRL